MIICVTGKMAAGKNYFCSVLQENGFISLDADLICHEVINENQQKILEIFLPIAQKLNESVFSQNKIVLKDSNGNVNRRELARILFFDKKMLQKQEDLIYPLLVLKIKNLILENSSKNIILNATVLYKIPDLLKMCQKIIFVSAPFFVRFLRAKKRDKMPSLQILSRFKAQKNLYKMYKSFGIELYKFSNTGKKEKIQKFIEKNLLKS